MLLLLLLLMLLVCHLENAMDLEKSDGGVSFL